MEAEFLTFNELMNMETGIGINHHSNTINASPEWWDWKIKTPSQYFQARAFGSGQSHVEDYRDENDGSDESNSLTDVPSFQLVMRNDDMGIGLKQQQKKVVRWNHLCDEK
ncbi:hypothetical protein Adt_11076 [Abeliophyllum distichum]|uniref:Uncharacterized protein n=1 Tax=Abeliophyllum distichum TaxID=126358 RepID=A0ABD1ULY2_9LAMI